MTPLNIAFNAKEAPPQLASPIFKPVTGKNNRIRARAMSPILKDHTNQFAAALAHEVRNPLANINLSVEMLQSALKDNDLKIYLDIIVRSSLRINILVNELLTCQAVDEVRVEKHSIHQLLDEVLELAKDRITLKNISVSKDYATQDCKIVLNRQQMKVALTNIVINAIDAMAPKKGKLKLVTESIGSKYIIQIGDNGCGISQLNLKNIFKPYFTNKPGGLGLGLSTTYNILRSNHVLVNVESTEGLGTRFILLFDTMHI